MSYINREDFLEQRRKVYCENCDRRKGLRNGKLKTLYEIGDAPCRACAINDVLDDVEDAPAADVRPVVRGKWIPVGVDDMDEGMYKCSECGSEHFFPEILLGIPADNYCPNCGADMREKEP